MKNKQTAVDWLINEWMHLDAEFDMVLIDKNTYWEKLKEKHNQAKEMHKQEIIDAFWSGDNSDCTSEDNSKELAKQYYKQTFGK
jgi:hypothetical protein